MKTMKFKRTLLVLTLLAMTMFAVTGGTIAWFTDEVTSANNVIQSGNLDIEFEYWDGDSWEDVSGKSDILTNTLWEPGVTEIAYLKVRNAGSLALKYLLGVNIANEIPGTNVAGDTFNLSDYIKFGVVENVNGETNPYTDREAAIAALSAAKALSAEHSALDSLNVDEVKYVALVVYMPTTVGNEANHKTGTAAPQIDLGIRVEATQLVAENDSFGEDYDADAYIPENLEDTTLEIVPGGGTQTGTITVKSPGDLLYLNKLAKEWVSLYSNGQGTNVGSYRENVGGKGTDYYYHWTWDIELVADLDMSNIPMNSIDISYWDSFDGNGHTISNVVLNKGQDGLFNNGAKEIKNLNVKNITVNAPEASTVGAVAGNGAMTKVHVENATVIGGKYVGGICGKGSSFIDCSIKNSTVFGYDKTVGGLVGYSIGDPGAATVSGNLVEKVTVTGTYNVGGLLGQAQNETIEGNTVKDVTVESTMELPSNASSNEVRTAKLAARSNFNDTFIRQNTIENVKEYNCANTPIEVDPAPLEEDFLFPAGTNAVMYKDMKLTGDAQIVHEEDAVLGLSNVIANVDHDLIIRKSGGAICISDCEFTLTNGAKLITVGEGGDAYQVFLINVKVNGELLTNTNADQYLEGISWFGAYPEWPNT